MSKKLIKSLIALAVALSAIALPSSASANETRVRVNEMLAFIESVDPSEREVLIDFAALAMPSESWDVDIDWPEYQIDAFRELLDENHAAFEIALETLLGAAQTLAVAQAELTVQYMEVMLALPGMLEVLDAMDNILGEMLVIEEEIGFWDVFDDIQQLRAELYELEEDDPRRAELEAKMEVLMAEYEILLLQFQEEIALLWEKYEVLSSEIDVLINEFDSLLSEITDQLDAIDEIMDLLVEVATELEALVEEVPYLLYLIETGLPFENAVLLIQGNTDAFREIALAVHEIMGTDAPSGPGTGDDNGDDNDDDEDDNGDDEDDNDDDEDDNGDGNDNDDENNNKGNNGGGNRLPQTSAVALSTAIIGIALVNAGAIAVSIKNKKE